MPFADKVSPAPREVRAAGAITALPGIAMLVFAGILLAGIGGDSGPGNNVFAEVGYYLVVSAGTLACAAGLVLGKTWARSPSVVVALLLIGVGWYTGGPGGQPEFGVPIGLLGVVVLVLLFRRPSRAWALGTEDGETEEEAARRDGAEGRAARRKRAGES
ncbi:hypothetical protein CFN78_09380 [Amycolatopsis antarctica]|uniref:Integral membrane protein n=1 Tax=Amycolatopsis antarctica TaxID=1854586 RepID=A0A263D5D4_9PSEU|nr:hypothetical protein [Amycolatopsis antarctica]OZM73712.1 hypothetical protein CFN78_09380 [Amycolatopsis antarctica]